MNEKLSKTNDELGFLNARLDEIRMSGHERLKAKAHLARAQAMADVLAAIARGIHRVLRAVVIRPYRRLTASLG